VSCAALSPLVYGILCTRIGRGTLSKQYVWAFAAGLASSYIAFLAERGLASAGFIVGEGHLFFGFLTLVAVPEEVAKLATLLGLMTPATGARISILLLGCFIGVGFAAAENVIYLQNFGADVLVVRFFTATAFHTFNGILMARILTTTAIVDESFRIVSSLASAVLLHGAYDALIANGAQNGGQFVFVLAFSVAAGYVSLKVMRPNTI